MYNIARVGLASLVIGFMQVPDPIPYPSSQLPVGTLPWSLPQLPIVDIDFGVASATVAEVTHTSEYADNLADINTAIDGSTSLQADLSSEIDNWLGASAEIPDITTEGDIATGINAPGYGVVSAYDIAAELGANLGAVFNLIRGFAGIGLDLGGAGYVIGFIVLCLLWMLFVVTIKFAIQLVDMLFSVAVRLIELIPFAE